MLFHFFFFSIAKKKSTLRLSKEQKNDDQTMKVCESIHMFVGISAMFVGISAMSRRCRENRSFIIAFFGSAHVVPFALGL